LKTVFKKLFVKREGYHPPAAGGFPFRVRVRKGNF